MKALAFILAAATLAGAQDLALESPGLRLEFDPQLHSRVLSLGRALGPFCAAERIQVGGRDHGDFQLQAQHREAVQDGFGPGQRLVLEGRDGDLAKTVAVTLYDAFPTVAVFEVSYRNQGGTALPLTGWCNHGYTLDAQGGAGQPAFWGYFSGSSGKRRNWTRPLRPGTREDNFQGMNGDDYGGGTPVADLWDRRGGLAVGHLEPRPVLLSLPMAMPDASHATLAVQAPLAQALAPGEVFRTPRTFLAVHRGDCFQALVQYRGLMARQGFHMADAPEGGFDPIWCAWGYGRKVQPAQVYGTLPTVKRMGFSWVTFDDGWQNNYGDWQLDPAKFPGGDADMKAIVDRIHRDGFRAQLWWCPLSAVAPSRLLRDQPDLALLHADGSRCKISWWNSFYLCPGDPRVLAQQTAILRKILVDWGFDGLKLDGQHMNAVPPCYNPAHHHVHPEDACTALPEFFRAIMDAAQAVKPKALVEFCPCGTTFSFFTMPHFNMSVASDPSSSYQVRSKGKVLKALMGDGVPYFGDHVELTESHEDFASTLAVGGVPGTQFVLPGLASKPGVYDLTPGRARRFQKWLDLYRQLQLSRGTYLGGLYDLGFDRPEAHAIAKGDKLYYGFFAKDWNGKVELRGLADRDYQIRDYVDGRELGTVHGPVATLPVRFRAHLLLEATPR